MLFLLGSLSDDTLVLCSEWSPYHTDYTCIVALMWVFSWRDDHLVWLASPQNHHSQDSSAWSLWRLQVTNGDFHLKVSLLLQSKETRVFKLDVLASCLSREFWRCQFCYVRWKLDLTILWTVVNEMTIALTLFLSLFFQLQRDLFPLRFLTQLLRRVLLCHLAWDFKDNFFFHFQCLWNNLKESPQFVVFWYMAGPSSPFLTAIYFNYLCVLLGDSQYKLNFHLLTGYFFQN